MSIKGFIVVALWALIGLAINTQFDPTTVIGSVMGSAFIFIWIGALVIGIFAWIKLNKK
jgi:Ca2+/Na+ antiporter